MTDSNQERHHLDRNKLRDGEPIEHAGLWSSERYAQMDAAFRGRLLDAIEAGRERVPEPPRRG